MSRMPVKIASVNAPLKQSQIQEKRFDSKDMGAGFCNKTCWLNLCKIIKNILSSYRRWDGFCLPCSLASALLKAMRAGLVWPRFADSCFYVLDTPRRAQEMKPLEIKRKQSAISLAGLEIAYMFYCSFLPILYSGFIILFSLHSWVSRFGEGVLVTAYLVWARKLIRQNE